MVSYHNDIMDTDYTDMQNILRSVTNKKEAMSMAGNHTATHTGIIISQESEVERLHFLEQKFQA